MSQPAATDQVHHSSGRAVLSVEVAELSLATVVILLRTYTRLSFTRDIGGWSYFWALAAWVGGLANSIALFLSYHYGLGKHIWDLTPDAAVAATKWSWVADAISRVAAALGRTAVAAFIYEIQGPSARRWRKVFLWVMAVSNILFGTFIFFLIFFRCSPPAYVWDKRIVGGTCLVEFNRDAAYFIAGWGATSDLILACYPATIILILQKPWRVKAGISILMGLGVFACICATVRTYHVHVVNATEDTTYVLAPLAIWSITELWVILIVSSVAPLCPLFKRIPDARNHLHAPSRHRTSIASNALVEPDRSSLSMRKDSLRPHATASELEYALTTPRESYARVVSGTESSSALNPTTRWSNEGMYGSKPFF